jgi:hypothetical protein
MNSKQLVSPQKKKKRAGKAGFSIQGIFEKKKKEQEKLDFQSRGYIKLWISKI